MPDLDALAGSAARALAYLPWWAESLILIVACCAVVMPLHGVVYRAMKRAVSGKSLFWRSLVSRTRGPSRLGLIVVAISLASTTVHLSWEVRIALNQILLVAFVTLTGWCCATALHIATVIYLRRFKLDAEDNLLARKHFTQMRILERAGVTLVALITLSVALMTFEPVRQYGVSLLASAGAAGLVLGLAMQPVLSNLVAGIQIAITQPIRIEDAIIVENEWGWVEEITATYVVVRLWDWRRLVLPLTYFIQKPFQNWTRDGASLIGSVFVYVDHRAPVAAMREKLAEIARATPLWDGKVVNLQVSDAKESTIEIRMLVSARNAPQAWDLRCVVREAMITWLQAEHPEALPRHRTEWVGAEEPALRRAEARRFAA
ncbi:mechanosensitive ion channel [Methylobacterium sp. 092160098-2]|uniref:mechanosensitive ion channel family protein n=1 Tax=unclassified Methylobacterium TaxID=2615210 RepID=UPI00238198E1|nr:MULTISPECIES: mechanosensitive ion channel domain-containing protein [unclassified Methylobacterium]MDE4915406.1 mechanosensitive ion channel [Methylobacterium sp. 092160098-2]WFS09043.1 mechanosensitive ion channel [Methylobacterium sp. 391_Methyba4]